MNDSFTVLRACLVEEFEVPAALVTPEATLASLSLDSLALVELSLLVEERIGVTVRDIRPDSTLGELLAHAGAAPAEADGPGAVPVVGRGAAAGAAPGALPAPGAAPLVGVDLTAGAVS
ncbi:phosphopantetheine-binding protein [Kitasatospora sp. NPDC002965]|uniref:acyl carrier protein n=1 Tax=Kitasatospora sp. NPDC002965 TaxID=3154775 RepID=UPI0033B9A4F1